MDDIYSSTVLHWPSKINILADTYILDGDMLSAVFTFDIFLKIVFILFHLKYNSGFSSFYSL